jgi:hypothetical protein
MRRIRKGRRGRERRREERGEKKGGGRGGRVGRGGWFRSNLCGDGPVSLAGSDILTGRIKTSGGMRGARRREKGEGERRELKKITMKLCAHLQDHRG